MKKFFNDSCVSLEPFRADQLYHGIYKQKITSMSRLNVLPKWQQNFLDREFSFHVGNIVSKKKLSPSCVSMGLKIEGKSVETAVINQMSCSRLFLATQKTDSVFPSLYLSPSFIGKYQNADPSFMVCQYLLMSNYFAKQDAKGHNRESVPKNLPPAKIYFTGGEPLENYGNLKEAIDILTDPKGIGLKRSDLTVITNGMANLIPSVSRDLKINLSINLHSVRNDLR